MKRPFFETLEGVPRNASMAGAAREMHVTPRAVSMQMKQMERDFGQPLFERAGLTVRPRPTASEIAAVLREPMGRLEARRLQVLGDVVIAESGSPAIWKKHEVLQSL